MTSVTQPMRTQISRENFGGNQVVWFPDLYTVDEIITEFHLPVLVKVVEGYMINDTECLESNTILSVHGYRRMKKFQAVDIKERAMSVPVTCKHKVTVLPNFTVEQFGSVADLCKLQKLPGYIFNQIAFDCGKRHFPAQTTFEVKSVVLEKGQPKGLAVSCIGDKQNITLPISVAGDFRETVRQENGNNTQLINDLMQLSLPISVEFQPSDEADAIYSPRIGTVILKQVVLTDVVYATNYEQGRRLLITFSRGLNIKLQIGRVIIIDDCEQYSTIAEPQEEPIDEDVLEYALHYDPYSGDYINLDYEEVRRRLKPEIQAEVTSQKKISLANNQAQNRKQAPCPVPKHMAAPCPVPKHMAAPCPVPKHMAAPPPVPKHVVGTPTKPPRIQSCGIDCDASSGDGYSNSEKTEGRTKGKKSRGYPYSSISQSVNVEKNAYVKNPQPPPLPPRGDAKGKRPPPKPVERQTGATRLIDDEKNINSISFSLPLNEAATFIYQARSGDESMARPPMPLPCDFKANSRQMPERAEKGRSFQTDTGLKESILLEGENEEYMEIEQPPINSLPRDTILVGQQTKVKRQKSDETRKLQTAGARSEGYEELILTKEVSLTPDTSEATQETQSIKRRSYEFTALVKQQCPSTEKDVPDDQDKTVLDLAFEDKEQSKANEIINECQDEADKTVKELEKKDIEGICEILVLLQLGEFADSFMEVQIDGALLIDLKEKDLTVDLEMTLFQATKVCEYMRGWKPDEEKIHQIQGNEVGLWTVSDVSDRMKSIRLNSFAEFCTANQVNGSLLQKILDKDVLDSVRNDHGVKLSNIDERKLNNYVKKGWRPKSTRQDL